MAYTITLDAGHGGFDNGASYNYRLEKDDNLALTFSIGSILQSYGFNVHYTRTEDVYDSPFQKATKANENGSDLFFRFTVTLLPFLIFTMVSKHLYIPIVDCLL